MGLGSDAAGRRLSMRVTVLGCSGGIGRGLNTTSLLIDDDLLIDAGDGLGTLEVRQMTKLRHVFITHSHLDHICHLPLLADGLFESLSSSGQHFIVHGLPATLQALREHIFNGVVWPDFTVLPTAENPVLRLRAMQPGDVVTLAGRQVQMIAVNHIVPAVAYCVFDDHSTFAFSGDTGPNDSLWEALNAHEGLDLLIVEAAFPNNMPALSEIAKHYCSDTLAQDLPKLRHSPRIFVSHLKPGSEEQVYQELRSLCPERDIGRLFGGEYFDL